MGAAVCPPLVYTHVKQTSVELQTVTKVAVLVESVHLGVNDRGGVSSVLPDFGLKPPPPGDITVESILWVFVHHGEDPELLFLFQ